jgi:hypothetical protein
MGRMLVAAFALAAALALISAAPGLAAPARLGGTFLMLGKLTFVQHVLGEHRGQRVQRTWIFIPRCATGACTRVTLVRRRSGKHIRDVVLLKRRRPSLYVGTGHFWIALKCAGQVVGHGGKATEKISVRITHTAVAGATTFATAIKATYQNPSRVNLTKCPGGIGRDGARYGGKLTSQSTGPPTAAFAAAANPATLSVSFTDRSSPGRTGAPIVAWSWNFGDPASASNTASTLNATHHYAAHGTYTVTLQVLDGDGQLASSTAQITI